MKRSGFLPGVPLDRCCLDMGTWIASEAPALWPDRKGKSRDPREARQPNSPTQDANAGRSGAFPMQKDGPRSTFERSLAGVCDYHPLNLAMPRSQRLSHYRCKPSEHKHSQHIGGNSVAPYKHVFGEAARIAGEQLECAVPLRTEAMFLWQPRP
jgi:hypothetical protein